MDILESPLHLSRWYCRESVVVWVTRRILPHRTSNVTENPTDKGRTQALTGSAATTLLCSKPRQSERFSSPQAASPRRYARDASATLSSGWSLGMHMHRSHPRRVMRASRTNGQFGSGASTLEKKHW